MSVVQDPIWKHLDVTTFHGTFSKISGVQTDWQTDRQWNLKAQLKKRPGEWKSDKLTGFQYNTRNEMKSALNKWGENIKKFEYFESMDSVEFIL